VDNLYQILENTSAEYSKKEALIFGQIRITYGETKEATDRLARGLSELGLGAGDHIALMLPNIPQFIMSYFAILKIGAAVVPVSIFCKSREIHQQLEDSEAKGIIYWEGFRSEVRQAVSGLDACDKRIVLSEKAELGEVRLSYLMERYDPLERTVEVPPDDTALIVYTGKTTDRPRGAELTHHNILSDMDACCEFLKLHSEDGALGVFPLYHPMGHTLIMGSFFRVGARIVLLPKFDAENILKTIENEKPTYFIGVPSMISEILKVDKKEAYDIRSLKYCLTGGDALTQETMDAFESTYKVPILEGYELKEASPMVSFNSPTQERKAGSIGLPLPGIEMKIVDENGHEVKPGRVGEIVIQGPNVMKGYYRQPEASKEVLKDGWLWTGDLALLQEDGFGFIVVRKKDMIVKSGFNVYPKEVETFLKGHPTVKEAVVLGVPDPVLGEEVHACVVLKDGEKTTPEEIINYSKTQLATYKCPSVVHFVDFLPKGVTGRVLRDKVRQSIVENKEK